MYTLDIETMRRIMLAHKKTGQLHADLPSGVSSLREPCRVEIALQAGNMVSCAITSRRGLLLTGDKAYQELAGLGRLRWTFVPPSSPTVQSGPANRPAEQRPASQSGPIVRPLEQRSIAQSRPISRPLEQRPIARPRRIVTVDQQQMRLWQRIHKLVYGLADGTRSVQEIAALLSATPEAIEEVLHDLQSIHVIEME